MFMQDTSPLFLHPEQERETYTAYHHLEARGTELKSLTPTSAKPTTMMKIAAVVSLLVSASSAFTTSPSSARTAALSAKSDFTGDIGTTAPLGVFDPLGVLDDASTETFEDLRLKELTHGRIAMLAVVGYLTTLAGVRFPGCEGVPAGLKAWDAAPADYMGGMAFTWIALGALQVKTDEWKGDFPGDFRKGFDFGWDKQSDAWKAKKRNVELNNGRAAQMGILGLVVHEKMGNLSDLFPTDVSL